MLRGLQVCRPPRRHKRGMLPMMIILLALGGDRILPSQRLAGADTVPAAVSLDIVTDPPEEHMAAGSRSAQVTFKASTAGQPLRSGRLEVTVTAPPAPSLLATPLPTVEGTTLLQLSSELVDGMFAVEYLFPMSGVYRFAFDIVPNYGGQSIPLTRMHHNLYVQADAASLRRAWLFRVGLFALGGIAGVGYARLAHRRHAKPSRKAIASGALMFASLVFAAGSMTFADHGPRQLVFPKGTQLIQGDAGWTLEVQPTPEQAVVGELMQLDVTLKQAGRVFSGAMEVAIHLYNLKDDQTVLRTNVVAAQGSTSQRFQLVKSVPHTCTVTVRPINGQPGSPVTLTAVLGVEVAAAPTPAAVKLRVLGLLFGLVGAGIVGGFLLTSGVGRWPGRVAR